MAAVKATIRSTYREETSESWNEFARTATATNIIVHRRGTGESGERKVVLGSAESNLEQDVDDMVGSATNNAEPRKCGQRGRNTCLGEFYYRRGFRGNEAVDCAILKKVNLTAWEVMNHRALGKELDKLAKQKPSDGEELAGQKERLRNEPRRLKTLLPGLTETCRRTKRVNARSPERQKEEVVLVSGGVRNWMVAQR